jgi:hypothetical protein
VVSLVLARNLLGENNLNEEKALKIITNVIFG